MRGSGEVRDRTQTGKYVIEIIDAGLSEFEERELDQTALLCDRGLN